MTGAVAAMRPMAVRRSRVLRALPTAPWAVAIWAEVMMVRALGVLAMTAATVTVMMTMTATAPMTATSLAMSVLLAMSGVSVGMNEHA